MYGEVRSTQRLTPSMVRVVLGGGDLDGFVPTPYTDQYINAQFFPGGAPYTFNTRYPLPDADTFAQYVGTYTRVNRENREDPISVEMERGKLTLRYPYDEVTSYLPIGPDIFMDPRWSIIIRFGRDPGGDVNNLLQRGLLFQRRR